MSLYGLHDLTFTRTNNANAIGDRLSNFGTPWFSGSRWGIIGSRNLPGGAPSLIFKLEGGDGIATGNMETPGTLFHRDARLWFYGDTLCKLTFCRANTRPRAFACNS